MKNTRKRFTAEEKVRLLQLHLLEKQPISDLCDQHGLNPNVFYRWQKQFFENAAAAFDQAGNGRKDSQVKKLEQQNSRLQAKLSQKDEVIAELVEHNISLKKILARFEKLLGRTRRARRGGRLRSLLVRQN